MQYEILDKLVTYIHVLVVIHLSSLCWEPVILGVPIFCHVDKLKEKENKSPFPENPGEIVCPPDAILISVEERYTSCKEINSLCIICARNDFEYSLCSSQNCSKKSYFRNDIVLWSACQVSNMVEGQNTRVKQCLEN